MRRHINNLISVIITFIRFIFLKLILWDNFTFYPIERFSPNVVCEFCKGGKVKLGKKVRVHSGSKIKARSHSVLNIGDNVKFNYNCIIVCRNSITIGEGSEFGPSVYIYDHDHDYRLGLKEDKFLSAPITIGKNCWIGANTIILRGTELGDNCVVGAGCILSGQYPSNKLIIQNRENTIKTIQYN